MGGGVAKNNMNSLYFTTRFVVLINLNNVDFYGLTVRLQMLNHYLLFNVYNFEIKLTKLLGYACNYECNTINNCISSYLS